MPAPPFPPCRHRPAPRRGAQASLIALVVASLTLVGCIEDGTITRNGTAVAPTTTTTSTTTTTVVDAGGSGAGETPSTVGAVSADEVSHDDSWWASPGEFRGRDGLRVQYTCPSGGALSPVWGTGPFTDDSSVCSAAVFAGRITLAVGGRVVVRISPGEDSYATGTRHGVTTEDYGIWAGSFDIVG